MGDDVRAVATAVAALFDDEVVVFDRAALPTAGVVVDDRLLALVRHHPRTFSLSLPHGPAWDVDGAAGVAAVAEDLAAAARAHPKVVSLLDCAEALIDNAVPTWVLSFPGTAVPVEAWLHERGPGTDGGSIGLFQEEATVRAVVWLGGRSVERTTKSIRGLEGLARWAYKATGQQQAHIDEARAEQARRDAIPVPTLEEVLARLRAGEQIATGGGRAWTRYRMGADGTLYCYWFDEGDDGEAPTTEERLAAAIQQSPRAFKQF